VDAEDRVTEGCYPECYEGSLPIFVVTAQVRARFDLLLTPYFIFLNPVYNTTIINRNGEKPCLTREIQSTDREIARLVYELYGLIEDEIKFVEE